MLGYMRGEASTGADGELVATASGGGRGVESIICKHSACGNSSSVAGVRSQSAAGRDHV
jgi:hypothetical protein